MHLVGYKEDQHLIGNRLSSTWIIFLSLLNAMEASKSMPDQNKEEGSQLDGVPLKSDEAVPPPTSDPKPSLVSQFRQQFGPAADHSLTAGGGPEGRLGDRAISTRIGGARTSRT